MDGCPGALKLTEEPESEDAHEQADYGDHHSQLSDAGQYIVVCSELRRHSSYWNGRNCMYYVCENGWLNRYFLL